MKQKNKSTACTRCAWVNDDPIYIQYHDQEWGEPIYDEKKLFEFLILEGAQAGLSWLTILKRRQGYQQAFAQFDPQKIAKFNEGKVASLLQNEGIIRNRLKINAAISNARAWLDLHAQGINPVNFLWDFVGGKPLINQWKNLQQVPVTTIEAESMSKSA